MTEHTTILFIADIVGRNGLERVQKRLETLFQEMNVDLIVANGENLHNGLGITPSLATQCFEMGIDVLTGGNHIWNQSHIRKFLNKTDRLLRPINYPEGTPGKGSTLVQGRNGQPVGVINVQGRTFMYPINDPFRRTLEEAKRLRVDTPIVMVDFHAEATAEKVALGRYLDGQVSALIGTHTHVQTADEQIFPNGTGYLSDAGMTGPQHSVIGMDTEVAIKRFMTQLPERYRLGTGPIQFCGVLITVDRLSGKCLSIKRIQER